MPKMVTELDRLEKMLVKKGVEFIRTPCQISSPYWMATGVGWSVVCHKFSYGGKIGLLEFWDRTGEPTGYLRADEALALVRASA